MFRIFFAIFPLIFCFTIHGQGVLSAELQSAISEANSNDFISIRIEFKENIDCYYLNNEFKENQTPVSQRAKIVIEQLQNQAEISQTEIIEYIETHYKSSYRNLKQFWLVNLIILEAKPDLINFLNTQSDIALLDFENDKIVMHDSFKINSVNLEKTPGGVENGLKAINAPAMWELGYTGRGRIVYDYDTGVWPDHPAFSSRYMGNFFPTTQSWFPWASSEPNGVISDHGTHTLGTILGLDTLTKDTIGVAFKSYWIANDYVNSTVGTLPPIADMILAFEWALNPDGDVSTTSDIPDVISNSWRWYDEPDTAQCGGYVVNLMNAIEAAGIANVFSAGNFGPSNTTVSAPQRINTSEVNTFSVGSINGNVAFPHPISSFSSIGPKQCPGTGSLSIHPEVVAPGQNVRSAWGSDSYNTISGTSMASPHVSGAILLLKEAFPYLSGEELLWALYLTAIDLGVAGEDNIYGMGLIDVHAAFLYLSATNTPIDPTNIKWDLAIVDVTNPDKNELVCTDTYSPTVTIKNLGDSAITAIDFAYSINSGIAQNYNWTGTLIANDTVILQLPSITATTFGNQELSIIATLTSGAPEYDEINNRSLYSFNRTGFFNLPFVEDFESGFESDKWYTMNPDNSMAWDTIPTDGLIWSNYSASMQLYDYSPRDSQKDGLIGPQLLIPISGSTTLKFDVAYQKKSSSPSLQDTLKVFVSGDCGQTFSDNVYEKTGDDLETLDTLSIDFVPAYHSHWRRDSIDLSVFKGHIIMIQFETTNRQGNNLYIDNISIYNGNEEPIDVAEYNLNDFSIYPNPAQSKLSLDASKLPPGVYSIEILNSLGQIIFQFETKSTISSLDVSKWPKGVYIISVKNNSDFKTERLIIH